MKFKILREKGLCFKHIVNDKKNINYIPINLLLLAKGCKSNFEILDFLGYIDEVQVDEQIIGKKTIHHIIRKWNEIFNDEAAAIQPCNITIERSELLIAEGMTISKEHFELLNKYGFDRVFVQKNHNKLYDCLLNTFSLNPFKNQSDALHAIENLYTFYSNVQNLPDETLTDIMDCLFELGWELDDLNDKKEFSIIPLPY
jgi:hypothetical protein